MNIENMTSAELFILAENKRAEEIFLEGKGTLEEDPVPKVIILKNTDTNKRLVECGESYIKDCLDGREIDEYRAFELVVELVYGDSVWEWWSKRG